MLQFDAKLISNRELAPAWKEMRLAWRPEAGAPKPGQFLTLRARRGFDPLLRRPFAIASFDAQGPRGSEISILYQVRGQATAILAELGPGAILDVLGPLGRPFSPPRPGERAILAAGGVGLGPILYLARELERLSKDGAEGPAPPFILLAGFRTAAAIPDIEFPAGAILCTDDGSAGHHGSALDWISHNAPDREARIYACGPSPMLAAIARLARERSWAAELSAEQWMACGVGACMGCALPRPAGAGFLRACADGPAFGRDEIDWEALS